MDIAVSNQTAGASSSHTLSFSNLVQTNLRFIDILYPAGFEVQGATIASVTNITNGASLVFFGQQVTYRVSNAALTDLAPNCLVSIELSGVTNAPAAGAYRVLIQTRDAFGDQVDAPTYSPYFTLAAASNALSYVLPRTASSGAGGVVSTISVAAGQTNSRIYLAGYDSGSNYIGDVSNFIYVTNGIGFVSNVGILGTTNT
ncbi:MAG: hypothetical protein J0L75_13885, partial [Spirochaetes bacterium]|nr:hypothetical protein [Spirochaetota bacterium]